MLIGQEIGKIDAKGRIAFPKRFREVLGEHLIITQGFEGSLIVVSVKSWEALLEGSAGRPFINKEAREVQRFLLGSSAQVELDSKGRFILPAHLRRYASIKEEVVILGISRYVEIWDSDHWTKHNEMLIKNIEPITKKLSDDR